MSEATQTNQAESGTSRPQDRPGQALPRRTVREEVAVAAQQSDRQADR